MSLLLEGFFLHEKTTFWTCFEGAGLNKILHQYIYCHILDKSSLKDSDEELEPQTTEKIELSSAKGLAIKVNPPGKSLM